MVNKEYSQYSQMRDELDEMRNILNNAVSLSSDNTKSTAVMLAEMKAQKELLGGLAMNVKTLDGEISNIKDDIVVMKNNERINKTQKRAISNAVHSRVRKLLAIEYDSNGNVSASSLNIYKRYYASFCRKCYCDCSKYGHLSLPYDETRKVDYDDAMTEIENWRPHGGVTSYIDYLDKLRMSA